MRAQFLIDMLIGWVIYTPEGKKKTVNKIMIEANKMIENTVKNVIKNNNIFIKNNVEYSSENEANKNQLTLMDNKK